MADSKLLLMLIFSLIISSTAIALITGESSISINPDIVFEDSSFNPALNMTRGVNYYDKNFGGFGETETGLISTLPTKNSVRFTKSDVEGTNYNNRYTITKNGQNYYNIVIRDTGYNSDSIILYVEPDRLTLRTNNAMGLLIGNTYEKSVAVSTLGNGGTSIIVSTEYDVKAHTLDVFIDGDHITTFNEVPEKSLLSLWRGIYYGGIDVVYGGFVVNNYQSNAFTVLEESGFDFFAFLNTLSGVMVWYTSPDLPDTTSIWYALAVIGDTFINIIIKVQQIGIIAYGVQLIRGN